MISEKTPILRIRLAIKWAYWPPKSMTAILFCIVWGVVVGGKGGLYGLFGFNYMVVEK